MAQRLKEILAYRPIHTHLVTSGQPTPTQFQQIKTAGFELVINLALTNASNAIAHEDQLVLANGMDYMHLPLLWETPSIAQASRVLQVLDQCASRKIWLHCALNYRVSSLMYVYQTCYLQTCHAVALQQLQDVWTPNPVWQGVIDQLGMLHKTSISSSSET